MKKTSSSPGRDLVRTVASEKFADVIFDVAEVALDENLAAGILKDMPIVGTVLKLEQTRRSIAHSAL